MTAFAVEVGARRQRDAGGLENAPTEVMGVVGQMADVGVEVEGAVDRGEAGQAGGRQAPEQQVAVEAVAVDLRAQLRVALERRTTVRARSSVQFARADRGRLGRPQRVSSRW